MYYTALEEVCERESEEESDRRGILQGNVVTLFFQAAAPWICLLPQTECEHSQVSTSPISLISPGSHCYIIHTSLNAITVQPQSRELLLSDRVHVRQQTQILEGKFDVRLLLVLSQLQLQWNTISVADTKISQISIPVLIALCSLQQGLTLEPKL